MAKKMPIFLSILFLLWGSGLAESATWHTFYWNYDSRVKTVEDYIAKWQRPGLARATRQEVLESARRAFGRDFRSWEEYKTFLRGPGISVEPCAFLGKRISHLEFQPRRVGFQIRDHLPGELCIRYQGADRISILCGQDIEPPKIAAVITPPAKIAALPAPIERPPGPSIWKQYEPPPLVKAKCVWRDIPIAPVQIGTGWNIGVWGRSGIGVFNSWGGSVTAQGGYGFKDCP